MNTTPEHAEQEQIAGQDGASATKAVFESLLKGIVSGDYAAGERLPAERELAVIHGASRPTLREALRRLGEWRLVEARRGSGVVVRHRREWKFDVFPAYLKYFRPGPGKPTIPQLLLDVLTLRRGLMMHAIGLVAQRVPAGGTASARSAVARAWACRTDARAFADADFEIMRALAEAASIQPALWLLNSMTDVYLQLAQNLAMFVSPPDDYVSSLEHFLDAVEAGDGPEAERRLSAFLERSDERMIKLLEVLNDK